MSSPAIHTAQQIETLITGAIVSFGVPAGRVNPDAPLDSLSLDPLDVTELCHLLEEQCEVPVTVDDVAACPAIGDLVRLVGDRVQRRRQGLD